jgi:hypothetical protein
LAAMRHLNYSKRRLVVPVPITVRHRRQVICTSLLPRGRRPNSPFVVGSDCTKLLVGWRLRGRKSFVGYPTKVSPNYRHEMEFLTVFLSGEESPISAQYWVVHQKHQLPYQAIILAGEAFPGCTRCDVRFEYASKETFRGVSLSQDTDLFPTTRKMIRTR